MRKRVDLGFNLRKFVRIEGLVFGMKSYERFLKRLKEISGELKLGKVGFMRDPNF